MGKVAKVALPLAGFAALAAMTGGAGAAAAGGAASGAAAGSTAAAAGGIGTMGGFNTMAISGTPGLVASAGATTAGTGSFFGNMLSGVSSFFSDLTTKDWIGLGLSGASGIASVATGMANAEATEAMLASQEHVDKLETAERELESQKRLAQVLASQKTYFAARGLNTGRGSALRGAEAAKVEADRNTALFDVHRRSMQSAYMARRRAVTAKKRGGTVGGILDFGLSAYDSIKRNQAIGAA